MKPDILSDYLQHLNEQGRFARFVTKQAAPFKSGAAFKKAAAGGVKSGFKWALLITPALWTGWRTATAAFSQAHRRCGTFSFGPGRKLCIIREKVKALRQKITILQTTKSQCSNKTSDPSACRNAIDGEINKIKLQIDRLQSQYDSLTGQELKESENLQEIVPFLLFILGSILVDKVLFTAWRSLKATYDADLRKCGIYKNNEESKVCMYNAKLMNSIKKQSLLRKISGECSKQKDPEKCRAKITKELESNSKQLQRSRDNLSISRKQLNDVRASQRI